MFKSKHSSSNLCSSESSESPIFKCHSAAGSDSSEFSTTMAVRVYSPSYSSMWRELSTNQLAADITRAFAPWACFRTSRQNTFNVTKRKHQASVSFCVSKTKNNVLIESSANIWDEYRSTNLLKVMTLEIGNQEIGMRPVNRWHVSLLWPLDGPNTCFSSKNKHRSNKLIGILCRAGLNFGHTQNVCMNTCQLYEAMRWTSAANQIGLSTISLASLWWREGLLVWQPFKRLIHY